MSSLSRNPLTPILELHRHRGLFGQFCRRAVEQRHRGSALGLFWTILAPLLSLCIYTFVFGFIWGGRWTNDPAETNLDYALGIFLGLILFNFLSEVLALTPMTIVTQPNFVKKVVFPLDILPAAAVGAAGFSAAISLMVALVGVAVFGPGLDWHALWLLAIIAPVALMAFGFAWLLSALGVFLRDIANLMPFIMQVLLYISAVFYPVSLLQKAPIWAQNLLLANPLLHAVESARETILWHHAASTPSLIYLWACSILIFLIGAAAFHKLRPAFADVI